MAYCCPEQREWRKHAAQMSEQLSDMVSSTTFCTGQKDVYHYEFDLDALTFAKLNKMTDFSRLILENKLLHTEEWPCAKLAALEIATTTRIEVLSKYKNL